MTGAPGPGGNFMEQLLGDLLQLMGGERGADRVELARGLAQSVATGGQPEPNVDPLARIRLEELVRVAELHVAELTGLSPNPGGMPLVVDAVGPGAWAGRTLADWRFLVEAMTAGADQAAGQLPPVDGLGSEAGELMARFVAGMGPMLASLQLGSAVGHLARTTLGQYEVPIPRTGTGLLFVPANVDRFAEDWSLDPDEVRLWVCLREVTIHAVLGRAHVAERLRTLVTDVVRGMAGDAAGMIEQLQQADLSDPESLQNMLSDPEALLSATASPERARASAELMAVTGALMGYVEHVLDRSATRLLGGRGALAEAWRRRQVQRDAPARTAEVLFGLDLGPAQVARGLDFVRGVVERAGEEGLARLWATPATLPTPSEIDAPGLWLERISFEDDAAGA